jgi:ankyrin repeat protein
MRRGARTSVWLSFAIVATVASSVDVWAQTPAPRAGAGDRATTTARTGAAAASPRTAAASASATAANARDTRLVDAVKAGDHAAAIALLQKRANPNVAEPDGTTPLHWAVRNDDLALADRLLKAGADAKAANRYGMTALPLACENGNASMVDRLLKAGVSPNLTGPYGETALHTCARSGHVEAAKLLIARGASIDAPESWRGQTPMMWAAAQGHAPMIAMLAEAGADVNARSTVVQWDRQRTQEPRDKWLPPGGLTPLLLTARQGCLDCVDALLKAGADINVIDPDRQSALVLALINGHYDVAGALIDRGVEVNAADKVGRTALWAAVDAHTMPTSNRPSPRETVDVLSSLDVIKKLLDKGAAVDAALREQIPYRTKLDRGGDGVLGAGTTPLIRAAKAADVPVIKLLLERGANAKTTTRNGVNAVMMAANVGAREEDMTGRNKTQREAVESISLLVAAGADLNGADTQGRTAAHGAALWGLGDVLRFLGKSGAKLDMKDKRGFTPLDTAMGLAGGFGFDQKAAVVQEDAAKALREMLGAAPAPARN